VGLAQQVAGVIITDSAVSLWTDIDNWHHRLNCSARHRSVASTHLTQLYAQQP